MRQEIEAQVSEFLRRGGEIDVVSTESTSDVRLIGDTWHAQVETPVPNP